MWEYIPLCGCKIQHTGTQGVVIPGFVFLISPKHANTNTGLQEPQSEQKNSLHVATEINSL
jgi:hypothetical protein